MHILKKIRGFRYRAKGSGSFAKRTRKKLMRAGKSKRQAQTIIRPFM